MTPTPMIENTYSTELGELFGALAKAQGKIEHALKDKKNPFFKSSYADLTSVWEACREPLSSNGLCVIQTVEGTKEAMFLITWLGHSSGQWIKSKTPLYIMKQDPQSVGSSITYGKRYALSALVGVCADEDDDGEKAMGRKEAVQQKAKVEIPSEEIEKSLFEFCENFMGEDPKLIRAYLDKYSSHYKKSIIESIQEYSNHESFMKDFNIYKSRPNNKKAA